MFVKFNIRGLNLELSPVGLLDNYLLNGAELNPVLVDVMVDKLKDGDCFLDIGANIGYFSLFCCIALQCSSVFIS